MIKLNSTQLRQSLPTSSDIAQVKRNPIYIILEDVLDTYNVGAIFRVADAVAASEVILCGQTPTPPDHKISKASVETWQWTPWHYLPTASEAIAKLKAQMSNVKIIAIEQDSRSIPYNKAPYTFPAAFIVGHETEGIKKETLDLCDLIVEIPMFGVNESLNVMVSSAIVLFEAVKRI